MEQEKRNKGVFVTICFTKDEKAKAKAYAKKERIALGSLMRKDILDKADKSNEDDFNLLSGMMPSEEDMEKLKNDIKRSRGLC